MKGIKTTIVAAVCFILGITVFILWFLKKLDNSQLALGLSSIAALGTTAVGFLAKDSDKSHTTRNTGGHPDPTKEEK